MSVISYIQKCLLEEESITTLKDMGIKLEEGSITLGRCKVNCIKVYNFQHLIKYQIIYSNLHFSLFSL